MTEPVLLLRQRQDRDLLGGVELRSDGGDLGRGVLDERRLDPHTKVLEEGHDDDEAFVNQLADKRYIEFAKTFDFNRYGATATTFSRATTGVAEKYVRQTLEENAGETNTAVRLALYFERKAPEIKSVTEILADQALFTVVRTNLGLPESFSMLDIDRQIEIFKDRVDLEDER